MNATNETNRLIAEMANASNEAMAREANALSYKMFGEGNLFNALQNELARKFNAEEAEKSRQWMNEVSQVGRSLAAGLSPGTYSTSTPSASIGAASSVGVPGVTTGAPAIAAHMQPHQNINPVFSGIDDTFLGVADLFETVRKNTADIRRDDRSETTKEKAQETNERNAQTAEGMLKVAEDELGVKEMLSGKQAALYDSEAALNTQKAEFERLMAAKYPEVLKHQFNLQDAQAQSTIENAAAAMASVSAQYYGIRLNDRLQRDLQTGNLTYQDKWALKNFEHQLAMDYKNFYQRQSMIEQNKEKIDQQYRMFMMDFDANHGGVINQVLDWSGASKWMPFASGMFGVAAGMKMAGSRAVGTGYKPSGIDWNVGSSPYGF